MRRVRESGIKIRYFESSSSSGVPEPPFVHLVFARLAEDDIFIHRSSNSSGTRQQETIWRCTSLKPLIWEPLLVGRIYTVHEQERYFVLTDSGLPSYVGRDTFMRQYKHLASDP